VKYLERIKDSKYFKNGKFEYPPNAWIKINAYKCSNCGNIIEGRPQTICTSCKSDMKYSIY